MLFLLFVNGKEEGSNSDASRTCSSAAAHFVRLLFAFVVGGRKEASESDFTISRACPLLSDFFVVVGAKEALARARILQ